MRNLARQILFLAFLLLTPAAFGGTILFLGDSLTAGLGVEPNQAFPAIIEQKIREKNLPYEVINAGLSGDTTAGGLARLNWVLQKQIDVFVLALGANDGLRGLPIAQMKNNLQAIIDKVKAKNPAAQIVIAGMQMPPNLGGQYAGEFRAAFPAIAQANKAAFVPFLLAGVGGDAELNQADQMHPNAAGHKVVAENVWRVLEPILTKSDR